MTQEVHLPKRRAVGRRSEAKTIDNAAKPDMKEKISVIIDPAAGIIPAGVLRFEMDFAIHFSTDR